MPIDQFIEFLKRSYSVTEAYEDFLRAKVKVIHSKAREQLLPEGHHQLVFYFVAKGMVYSWRREDSGDAVPMYFAWEGHFIATALHPLFPAVIPDGITCLENSILVGGKMTMAKEAMRQFPEAAELISLTVNQGQQRLQQFSRILTLHNATQRFQGLRQLAPELFQRVPDHLLGAYLNISRVHFNRIKNNMNRRAR